jgi:enediyne biosynthesis protein E4
LFSAATLLDALTTPSGAGETRSSSKHIGTATSPVQFVDVAREAGLNTSQRLGRRRSQALHHRSQRQRPGFFRLRHDGWLDIYLTNGTRLDANGLGSGAHLASLQEQSRRHVHRCHGKIRLARTGWQTGVCVGDYDNDGWDDLFCCFWGHNILFHNNGDGTFTDVTRKAGLYDEQVRWGAGCTFLDYDRDGHSIFSSATTSSSIRRRFPLPGTTRLPVEGHSCDVRSRAAFRRHQRSLSQQRRRQRLPMFRRNRGF